MLPKLNLIAGHKFCQNFDYIQIEKDYTVATNAHVLAAVPTKNLFDVDELPDHPIYVHKNDWVKLTKSFQFVHYTDGMFKIFTKDDRVDFVPIKKDVDYIKWRYVMPSKETISVTERMSFNAKLLNDLIQAMQKPNGVQHCTLQFHGQNKGMRVIMNDGEMESIGLIMPVTIPNVNTDYQWTI